MHERRRFGNEGEELAARYLEQKGYTMVARQWRHAIGELDLVADYRGELVFIEVKSRKSTRFGYPEAAVTGTKLRKLRMLAEAYVGQTGWRGRYRIDVVSVLVGTAGSIPDILQIEGVG